VKAKEIKSSHCGPPLTINVNEAFLY